MLNDEIIKQIQEADHTVSNAELGRQLGVHRETVAKYRKLKEDTQQEASNLLSGNEEKMRLHDKVKEGKIKQIPHKPTKEEKEQQKKLDLLQHYSPADIQEMLNYLASTKKKEIDEVIGEPGHLKFGLVSDTHFGSKECAREELQKFYEIAKDEGVECFMHAGDIVDGCGVYNGQQFEQDRVGFEEQVKDVIENYPNVGLKTYFVGGNHDEAYLKQNGVNITKAIETVRDDLINLGFYDAVITINGIKINLHHGGGSLSYAKDYKMNRFMDKIDPKNQPDIFALGHYHDALYSFHRGIHGFMPGAFLKENLLAKRFNLGNVIGGWIIDVDKNEEGECRVKMEFINL